MPGSGLTPQGRDRAAGGGVSPSHDERQRARAHLVNGAGDEAPHVLALAKDVREGVGERRRRLHAVGDTLTPQPSTALQARGVGMHIKDPA